MIDSKTIFIGIVVIAITTAIAGGVSLISKLSSQLRTAAVTPVALDTIPIESDHRVAFRIGDTAPQGANTFHVGVDLNGDGIADHNSETVVVNVLNRPPTANAGPDKITNTITPVTLSEATATDDGLPEPPALGFQWEQVEGPVGGASFDNATALNPTVSFSDVGVYTLRLTVGDGELGGSDDMKVIVSDGSNENTAPVVDAGVDQGILSGATALMAATVTDDGLPNPPGTISYTWSQVSGPGTATFNNSAIEDPSVTFSAVGVYVLRLSASDSQLSASDTVEITVSERPPQNTPPAVEAGPDQTILFGATALMAATVTDDGLPNPPASTTLAWTKVSGPGTVTFSDSTAEDPTVTFSTTGIYQLRLTVSDSELSASDTLIVTVNEPPSEPSNEAPVVDAGPNQTVDISATALMAATVTDDGLPNPPGTISYTWSQVSGPGTATFNNNTIEDPSVTFSATGIYQLRLTATDSELSASDTMIVTVEDNSQPPALDPRVRIAGDRSTWNGETPAGGGFNIVDFDIFATDIEPSRLRYRSTDPRIQLDPKLLAN